jgi:hypothetical protein
MIRITTAMFGGIVFLVAGTALAQTGAESIEAIREQIQALQEHLDAMEAKAATSKKVARLGSTSAKKGEPRRVQRVYDLSDLFSIAPNYAAHLGNSLALEDRLVFSNPLADSDQTMSAAGGGFGGGGFGGQFSVAQSPGAAVRAAGVITSSSLGTTKTSAARSTMNELIDAITGIVATDDWDSVGGASSIRSLGTSLFVSAEPAAHDQIEAIIAVLRQRWGTLRTVSIRARWLWLSAAEVEALLPGDGKSEVEGLGLRAFGIVDDGRWQEAERNAANREPADARGGFSLALTCFNGQTVSALAGVEEAIVTALEPVSAPADAQAADAAKEARPPVLRPVLSSIHEGVAFQVTPMVNLSGRIVVLDLHTRVALQRREPAGRPPRGEAGGRSALEPPRVDRPKLATQRFSTTLRLPVDRVMLAGGMSFPHVDAPAGSSLYLFVRASVQELRDDRQADDAGKPVGQADRGEASADDQG